MTSAVANVSFSACQANGFVTACQNASAPGSAACRPSTTRGSTTITPRYESVAPRTSASVGGRRTEDRPVLVLVLMDQRPCTCPVKSESQTPPGP